MVNETKIKYNSPEPLVLTDKAKMLNDQFYLRLNEIVKSYPSSKINPSDKSQYNINKTNKELYDYEMSQMLKLQNDYFLYKNDVIKSNETIQTEIKEIDTEINELESQNKVLRTQLDSLKASSYSAEGLFDDAQITRNQLFFSNFVLFCIIAGGGYMYYKKFKLTE
jgi:hypothetical protein